MTEADQYISWAANAASIISLVVSLYVAWEVRAIKERFVKRFAITAFIDKLRVHNKFWSDYIGAPITDNIVLQAELAKCEANLRSAIPHLNSLAKSEAKSTLELVAGRPPDVQAIYVMMTRLLQGLENAAAEQEVRAHVG